jgi:hypothetical protein
VEGGGEGRPRGQGGGGTWGGWECRWETELVEKDFQFSPLYLFLESPARISQLTSPRISYWGFGRTPMSTVISEKNLKISSTRLGRTPTQLHGHVDSPLGNDDYKTMTSFGPRTPNGFDLIKVSMRKTSWSSFSAFPQPVVDSVFGRRDQWSCSTCFKTRVFPQREVAFFVGSGFINDIVVFASLAALSGSPPPMLDCIINLRLFNSSSS